MKRPAEPLTSKEVRVLHWVAEGLDSAEVGERMHISEHTVKSHVHHILKKLGARNRPHAVALAIKAGSLPMGEGR